MSALRIIVWLQLMYLILATEKEEKNVKDKWKQKNLQDYNDADLERLYDQWEEGDEDELEEDEKPEWKREPPKIDLSKMDTSDPEELLKMSKKGRTMMMFASVSGDPTEKETETITQLWQSSLFNANIETQRYVVGQNRVIFMLKDGAKAWEIKSYLIQQERCLEVTIENQNFPGKGAKEKEKTSENNEQKEAKSVNDIKKEEL